jgi:hypothetical protein
MKREEVRLGNYVFITNSKHTKAIRKVDLNLLIDWELNKHEPIDLKDEILLKLGFDRQRNNSYINGFEYSLLLKPDHHKMDTVEYRGIGGHCFEKTGKLFLSVLRAGNYVGKSVEFLHEFQNHWFALTGDEFEVSF